MELRREAGGAVFRMRWEQIEPNSFDWSYSARRTAEETWTPLWEIRYCRVL